MATTEDMNCKACMLILHCILHATRRPFIWIDADALDIPGFGDLVRHSCIMNESDIWNMLSKEDQQVNGRENGQINPPSTSRGATGGSLLGLAGNS